MPRKKRSKEQHPSLEEMAKHVDKIERSIQKGDPRHEWLKSNNMKQYTVVLRDVKYLE